MQLWFKKGAWASKKAKLIVEQIIPDEVMSIAVIRHAALGDMVLTRCFLVELRKHFPNANLTLSLISNYTRGAPEDLVDRIHVVCGSDQRNAAWGVQFKKLRELGYHDLIFDLAATSRSFLLCRLNSAKLKIGFPYRLSQRHLYYDVTTPRTDLVFEADDMLKQLNIFGLRTSYPPKYNMPGTAKSSDTPYIIYFTSASAKYKCWPDSHFSGLLDRMAKNSPTYKHLILEGVNDSESIDNLIKSLTIKSGVEPVVADSVEDTVALLKGAALVVSNDTSIRNIAITTNTPTMGIFFSTEPYRYWPRCGNHDIVFNSDHSVPSVEQVYVATQALLVKIGAV